ncbi:MAG: hypothetical protein ACI9EF_002253 [Pseudohongiellaceae bacterium]|jgi:hypothetical protein
MKKLLLGCGVLLALGLGSMTFVVWQLWPDIQQTVSSAEDFERRLTILEEDYPFDVKTEEPLNTERFAKSLDMRLVIVRNVDAWKTDIDAFGEDIDAQDIGFMDTVRGYFSRFSEMFEIISPLEDFSMSASEFNYHTRVLWAALDTIDAGAESDPAFESLRGLYPTLLSQYKAQQKAEGSMTLAQLIGEFDPAVLSDARGIMKTDPQRVIHGVTNANAETIFMGLPNGPQGDVNGPGVSMGFNVNTSTSDEQ